MGQLLLAAARFVVRVLVGGVPVGTVPAGIVYRTRWTSAVLLAPRVSGPIMEEISCWHLFERPTLELPRHRIGARRLLVPLGPEEAFDIYEGLGLPMVEALLPDGAPADRYQRIRS